MTRIEAACPACGARSLRVFHEEPSVPVHSCLLLDSAEEARTFPRGSIRLALCDRCGFITNLNFDPALERYSARYEETQACSPRFQSFARDVAERWVERYDLQGKHVLEIGCGKGDFLVRLVEAGAGSGTGIDPSVIPERVEARDAASRLTWIVDHYSERYARLKADAIVCRHTLEHIQPVGEFLRLVRSAIGDRTDTVVLFELPDTLRVLHEVAFWDVYYEHCSYFTPGSLARLFRAEGFKVVDVSLAYDDQYVLIEARPASGADRGAPLPIEDDREAIFDGVERFATAYGETVRRWRKELAWRAAAGERTVIWGGGSKAVAFLNALAGEGGDGGIEYAVDINPRKHDRYIAGTGQRVVSPEFLREYRPGLVIAMNPIYREEISRDLDALGVDADLVTV